MNANSTSRKAKSLPARATRKPAPEVSSARTPPTAAPAKRAKPKTVSRVKISPPSAIVMPQAFVEPVGGSKQSRLIAMLHGVSGATIEQMIALTGWQAHTVRGTISGVLRKKLGLNVRCEHLSDSGKRLYRIIGPVGRA